MLTDKDISPQLGDSVVSSETRQEMHSHARVTLIHPFFRLISEQGKTKLVYSQGTRYQDATPPFSILITSLTHLSWGKMRASCLNPGSVALTAGLLVILTELSTSSLSMKKDCPKGQVRRIVSTDATDHKFNHPNIPNLSIHSPNLSFKWEHSTYVVQ